jgi:hypothetical protein
MGNLTACEDAIIWAIDLKQGMELQPWAPGIERLATTPTEARALLRDAAAIIQARASYLTASGLRTWQPTPQMPALVVVIDEYAELADTVPDALAHADSVARLGRAVAVTLIAATQRPTQQAMGQRAIRSQMDVRIAFRVREKGDADLILGRGMRAAGWHADTLNAPGKFLISAPEHDVPRRARAYLLTDESVYATADARRLTPRARRHLGQRAALRRPRQRREHRTRRPRARALHRLDLRQRRHPGGDALGRTVPRSGRGSVRRRADERHWHEPPLGLPQAPRADQPAPGNPGQPRILESHRRTRTVIVYVYISSRASALAARTRRRRQTKTSHAT